MARSRTRIKEKSHHIVNRITRTNRFRHFLPELISEYRSLTRWSIGACALLTAGLFFYFLILQSPERYVNTTEQIYGQRMPIKEHLDSINTIRVTMLSLLSGCALFIGAYLTLRNVNAAEKNVKLAQEGQITGRFISAVEKLGAEKLEIRLGGIYALERIARDSERDHWPIMEILTAFVRENGRWVSPNENDNKSFVSEAPKARQDIHAVMTVLGRRNWQCERTEQKLDLRETNLSGVDLTDAHLARARFTGSRFDRTIMNGADFEHADLEKCEITDCEMHHAFLQNANLEKTTICGTDLGESVLSDARFMMSSIDTVHAVGSEAEAVCFLKATIVNSDFGRCNLKYANFMRAGISGVSFHKSHLEWAKFTKAKLIDTVLEEAYLEGVEKSEYTVHETPQKTTASQVIVVEEPSPLVQGFKKNS